MINFLIFCFGFSFANAGSLEYLVTPQMTFLEAFYRDIHANPEVSQQETRTAGKVAEEFRKLGFETIDNIGGGVVGILRNGSGPVTLVRAELDALPMNEETGLPYKSKKPGVMHACGHDLHLTALIGAAAAMLKEKAKWRGTLVFVAQPAEETLKGAQAMIDAGLFKKIPKPNQFISWHVYAQAPAGMVSFRPGEIMATYKALDVTLRGKGTHAGAPQKGIDPFILTAEFTLKMQSLVGRETEPTEPTLISIGSIHGGSSHGVIPEEVKIQMGVRAFSEKTMANLIKRIEDIAKGLAKTAGAPEPTVTVVESAAISINDPNLASRFRERAAAVLGKERLFDVPQLMPSEDFGTFGRTIGAPSLQFRVGAQMAKDKSIVNHSPRFAPDFKIVVPAAVETMVAGLLDLHSK